LSSPDTSRLVCRSPLGNIVLEAEGEILTKIALMDPQEASEPLAPQSLSKDPANVLLEMRDQLKEYFAGNRETFTLDATVECSQLERFVWSKLSEVPYGQTINCSKMASLIRRSRYFSILGLTFDEVVKAVENCPLLIVVPTHRLVNDADQAVLPFNPVNETLRNLEGMASRMSPISWLTNPEEPRNFTVPVNPGPDRFLDENLNVHVNGRFVVDKPTGDPGEREELFDKIRQALLNGDFKVSKGPDKNEVNAFDAAAAQRLLSTPEMTDKMILAIKKSLGNMDQAFLRQESVEDADDDDDYAIEPENEADGMILNEFFQADEKGNYKISGRKPTGPFNPALISVLPNEDLAELIASTIESNASEDDLAKAVAAALDDGVVPEELVSLLANRSGLNVTDVSLAHNMLKQGGHVKPVSPGKKSKPQAKAKPQAKSKPKPKK
jgi:methylated-DNA-[protein]-cysteine S-methyltransferase